MNNLKPQFNQELILHRLCSQKGASGASADQQMLRLVEEGCTEIEAAAMPRYTYRVFPINRSPFTGKDISRHLKGCDRFILTAITLGEPVSAAIRRAGVRSTAHAVTLDACASVYVESFNDGLNQMLSAAYRKEQLYVTPSYSPGYGDLDIRFQQSIAQMLEIRRIGISLTKELILVPSKSILSIIGLSKQPVTGTLAGCSRCSLRESCSKDKCTLNQP